MPRLVRHFVPGLFGLALLVGVGYGAWRGYCSWQASVHVRAANEQTAAFHYETAYEHARKAVRLRPARPDVQLLASRTARRVMDMAGAKEHLRNYAKLTGRTEQYTL